jgi:hypothetical protein
MCVVHPKFTYRFHPRTGSTATSNALEKLPGVKKLHHHLQGVPGPVTACTIRNPLDLVASWFAMYTRTPKPRKGVNVLTTKIKGTWTYPRFCDEFDINTFVGEGDGYERRMFYHLPTDEVIVYERLEEDLEEFLAKLDIPMVTLERTPPTAGKLPYEKYYEANPEAEGILRKRFPKDFDDWEKRQ